MVDQKYIFVILQDGLLTLALLLTIIYALLILCIRRLHQQNNMFILNICFAVIVASMFFITYFTYNYVDPEALFNMTWCFALFYSYSVASLAVPFSFMVFSVNRFFFIVYHTKAFFKTRRWVAICIAGQWLSIFALSTPFLLVKVSVCSDPLATRVYTGVLVIIVPSFTTIVFNSLIFLYVRSSSRRIAPNGIEPVTGAHSNHVAKRNSRELSLLQQLVFVFATFIGGWSPIYLVRVINQFIDVSILIYACSVLLCELALVSVVIHLFIRNPDLRSYLSNKIRRCFGREHGVRHGDAWTR